jgi:hypothetical protein
MSTPNFNFDAAWNQILSNSGQTRVVLMNGIHTTSDQFNGDFTAETKENFIIDSNKLEEKKGSILFQPVYNPSFLDPVNLLPTLADFFSQYIFKKALDYLNSLEYIDKFADIFSLLGQVAQNPTPSLLFDDQFTADLIQLIAENTPFFNELTAIIDALPDDFDLKESLAQFWYPNPVEQSRDLNSQWIDGFLDNSKNSLILIGHSQGNFFLEDAIIDMGKQNDPQVKVITFGSPTQYAAAGLSLLSPESYSYGSSSNLGDGLNVVDANDLVAKLQLSPSQLSNPLAKLMKLGEAGITGLLHGMSPHGYTENYLPNWGTQAQQYFQEAIYQMNPTGYYFPTSIAILNDFLCIGVLMDFGKIKFMFLGEKLKQKFDDLKRLT